MKLALLLNVIDPGIGGVLIMGDRGTGKSTAVRALADLLPQILRVRGCPYGCDPSDEARLCDDCRARLALEGRLAREKAAVPVVDLPLGATEDRVCGTLNIERALTEGVRAFEPGLLARANRGFLYIDEVNLLEDHLVDLLLDAAVTGRNQVEREGISIEHPARFVLVGSGNPEEGELRPQLLDRFGLHVEVRTIDDVDQRVQIIEQSEAFKDDPEAFYARAQTEQESLRRKLTRARRLSGRVSLSRELLRRIAELCRQLKIDGHRGELTITRAARQLAALEGRAEVSGADVRRVAAMSLRHRLRRDPLEETARTSRIERRLDELFPPATDEERARTSAGDYQDDEPHGPASGHSGGTRGAGGNKTPAGDGHTGGSKSDDFNHPSPPALDAQPPALELNHAVRSRRKQSPAQRRSARRQALGPKGPVNAERGRYVRAVSVKSAGARIALDATLRAVAGQAPGADREAEGRVKERSPDPSPASHPARPLMPVPADALRYKRFRRKAGTLFIFAVDTSGSMAPRRVAQAKGALVRLLEQSYVRRDRVALVSFRRESAEALLRPSRSVTRARRILDGLELGGATPLAAGLASALEIARRAGQEGGERIMLLLFTDGRANVALGGNGKDAAAPRHEIIRRELEQLGAALRSAGVITFVVDTEQLFTSTGKGRELSETIGGRYLYLPANAAASAGLASLVDEARH